MSIDSAVLPVLKFAERDAACSELSVGLERHLGYCRDIGWVQSMPRTKWVENPKRPNVGDYHTEIHLSLTKAGRQKLFELECCPDPSVPSAVVVPPIPIEPPPPPAPRLVVIVETSTLTLDGQAHTVLSDQALRWVKVLADSPGSWFSGTKLDAVDKELVGVRTDKLIPFLPDSVQELIDRKPGKGSRIRL